MGVFSEFFEHTNLHGRLFFAGTVEGSMSLEKPPGGIFIHVIERGRLILTHPERRNIDISQPSVIFSPSSCRYQLVAHGSEGVDLVCASFQFGPSGSCFFPLGLRETLIFPYRDLEKIGPVIALLVREFRMSAPGRFKVLNLLFEYVFVLLVRRAVSNGYITDGLLYAMQDSRIGSSLISIHREPQLAWSVERLAGLAKMPPSKFSALFSNIMSMTPMEYVNLWRMKVAQDLLCEGKEIKIIADSLGYTSQELFSRTFAQCVGLPPEEWLHAVAGD